MKTAWSAPERVPEYNYYWTVGTVFSRLAKPYKMQERGDEIDRRKFEEGNYYRTLEHAQKATDFINAPYLLAAQQKAAEAQKKSYENKKIRNIKVKK